jgi:hypothetical protein
VADASSDAAFGSSLKNGVPAPAASASVHLLLRDRISAVDVCEVIFVHEVKSTHLDVAGMVLPMLHASHFCNRYRLRSKLQALRCRVFDGNRPPSVFWGGGSARQRGFFWGGGGVSHAGPECLGPLIAILTTHLLTARAPRFCSGHRPLRA